MSQVLDRPVESNGQSIVPVRQSISFGISNAMDQVALEEKMFELAQRKANIYAKSSLVPKEYQNNIGNVLIAENMARRMGADTLMVMQNLYVVHGRPGWSAQFLIATFNSCGRFSAIKYEFSGTPGNDDWGCVAFTTEFATGEILKGTRITMALAKKEGWVSKNGSKWQSMPEQMMRYRAATFLIRVTAPEIGMGLLTKEEIDDLPETEITRTAPRIGKLDDLTDRLIQAPESVTASEVGSAMEVPAATETPSEAAKSLIKELTSKLESATGINEVKELATESRASAAAALWPDDLKAAVDDQIVQLGDERIASIRATRGEGSNK